MKSFVKENWLLLIVLGVASIAQTIYWQARPELGNCYDCGEYQDLANFISRNPENVISDFRPPLYPILMIVAGLANPNPTGDRNLFFIQSFVLLLTIVVLWFIAKRIRISPYLSFLTLLVIIVNPAFFSFTKFKLTETLNLFFLTLLVYSSLILKSSFNIKNVLLFAVVATLLTFTRFANSYLGIAVFVIIGIYLWRELLLKKRSTIVWVLGLFLITTPQFLYSLANSHRNYYFGLTGETGTNLLGKLVQYQLIPKEDPEFPGIVREVSGCKGTLASADVFTCVWNFLPKNSFVSKYSVNNTYVDAFTKKYILHNLPVYLYKSIPVAFEAVSKPVNAYLVLSQTKNNFIELGKNISGVLGLLLLVWTLSLLPLFLIINIKKIISLKMFPFTIMFTISAYYVAITGLAAINDYQRIASPALPFLYVLMTYSFKMFHLPKKK